MALVLNVMLRAIDPHYGRLGEEPDVHYVEMLAHAQRAKRRRPFGASHIPLGRISAWAAVDGESRRAAVRALLSDYETGLAALGWQSKADLAGPVYDELCRRLAACSVGMHERGDASDDSGCAMEQVNAAVAHEQEPACCIL